LQPHGTVNSSRLNFAKFDSISSRHQANHKAGIQSQRRASLTLLRKNTENDNEDLTAKFAMMYTVFVTNDSAQIF